MQGFVRPRPLRLLALDDPDEFITAHNIGAGWYEEMPITEDRFKRYVDESSPERPSLPSASCSSILSEKSSTPSVAPSAEPWDHLPDFVLPPPPKPPAFLEKLEKPPLPPQVEEPSLTSDEKMGESPPRAVPVAEVKEEEELKQPPASSDPMMLTEEELERQKAEVDDLMERALSDDMNALNLLFDLEPGVNYTYLLKDFRKAHQSSSSRTQPVNVSTTQNVSRRPPPDIPRQRKRKSRFAPPSQRSAIAIAQPRALKPCEISAQAPKRVILAAPSRSDRRANMNHRPRPRSRFSRVLGRPRGV